ncbi:hypothetical protein PDE_03314 [Penicillium oxalicum 114-2]|uniref:Uncharacterized protein n=1 Tax=Penicillium oxalicum (strain 114-2 / CGMCC 5302) TaxID=933388 RepID=S8AQW7_PENO1|nr:hypothetical protein PDE_03314 [Penicillium oxalicum 114-2]
MSGRFGLAVTLVLPSFWSGINDSGKSG